MSFQTCVTSFLLWNIKKDILKNVGNQTFVFGWSHAEKKTKMRHFSKYLFRIVIVWGKPKRGLD